MDKDGEEKANEPMSKLRGSIRLIHRMSISKKISFSFILFFTILIMLVIIVIRVLYGNFMFSKLKERTDYESKLISQQIDKFVDNINGCANNLIISLNTNFDLEFQTDIFPDSSDIKINRNIFNTLDSNVLMFNDAGHISVVFENDVVYSKDNRDPLHNSLSKEIGAYRYLNQLDVDSGGKWCYGLDKNLMFGPSPLCYVKSLRNIYANRIIGYIIINVDEAKLHELYWDSNSVESSIYFINNEYMSISSSDRDGVYKDIQGNKFMRIINLKTVEGKHSGNVEIENERYYYRVRQVNHGLWNFVLLINLDMALAADIDFITIVILIIGVVSVAVFYVVIILISKNITKPIQNLAKHMIQFQDTLPEVIPESSVYDEIGIFIASFNIMVQKNKKLFDRVLKKEREKQHYELALMQTQIKPHFLYNTLDTIYCLVDMNRLEEGKKATKLLAEYYRFILNKGCEWTSLEKELGAIRKYLEIQKMRYRDIINYRIDVSSDIMYMQIPKLTMQPLVENAIYHGIKPKNCSGNILITGEMQGEWVYIRVSDDGVGMTDEEFGQILITGKNDESHSFGLKNVEKRLKLFYGDNSRLYLEHDDEYSTVILIAIFLDPEGGSNV